MTGPTAILAEDEAPQREQLKTLLGALWPQLRILAECPDGRSAIEAMARLNPDVAFLDIRMPGADGLEVARAAGDHTHVVLITAYDEFALQAFEDGAVDYLLKPVKRDRLALAVSRLQARLTTGEPSDLPAAVARLESLLGRPRAIKWITASVGTAVRVLPVDDVHFFQAHDKYTRVVAAGDEAHIRTPLKELIGQLDPDQFWQVHRGAIVRLSAIRLVKRDEDGRLVLHLHGRVETLPVSQAFAARFKSL
ncbi:LytTR family DNA-binding domain-containing protein [Phenylobacterium sp.]|jgi:DNA-binding LytR/AlgR family response regulator|uniref:LytR/AlgR family response regulator transcription factor n=1 Tax=Phenylobacterium sp. TaxID=1871053 RepID=UPI002E350392|nr:LytTR family DNA-binding domain-containing protein [Phenylobacterium sp.]HEX3363644.1 LytTR family DNA-binding domain-containing protein [Phenylobacterium sp.]